MKNSKLNNIDKPSYLGHRQRVRKKFLESLGKELHEYELLEILFFNALPRQDTKALAKKLIAQFGDISGVVNADIEMLKTVDGLGEVSIVNLKIIAEIINRILKNNVKKNVVLNNWQAVLDYAKSALASLNHEVFRVLFLDKNLQLIADELLARGENDHVVISAKNLVKKALLLNCSAIILMHNHPTSNLEPSSFDIKTTNEILTILKPLNIVIIDHLIVGKTGIFSFKQKGLL